MRREIVFAHNLEILFNPVFLNPLQKAGFAFFMHHNVLTYGVYDKKTVRTLTVRDFLASLPDPLQSHFRQVLTSLAGGERAFEENFDKTLAEFAENFKKTSADIRVLINGTLSEIDRNGLR